MSILTPYKLGDIEFSNRMVMAPMTRCRAGLGNVPGPLAATYYEQRSSAGLIITEGSQVSPQGVGFYRTPGVYSAEQVKGWKKVTRAVHGAGGKIFLQLWHVGRMSHPDYLNGELPVAPSAFPVGEEIHTPMGKKQIPVPRALELKEIPGIVKQFHDGAANAKKAGFDGVEIHGANGYLLDQFLETAQTIERINMEEISKTGHASLLLSRKKWSKCGVHKKVGYRISPHFSNHAMSDSNPRETFAYLAQE